MIDKGWHMTHLINYRWAGRHRNRHLLFLAVAAVGEWGNCGSFFHQVTRKQPDRNPPNIGRLRLERASLKAVALTQATAPWLDLGSLSQQQSVLYINA